MSKVICIIVFFSLLILNHATGQPLPIVNFSSPDTTCVGGVVNISNLTSGGSTYYWNFCSGNTSYNPTGMNIGNPGSLLNPPVYISLANDGDTCYSFVTVQSEDAVIRYNHGTSFANYPLSWSSFTNSAIFSDSLEGIKIRNENGNWYGFVCNNNKLTRLDFGNSLANSPTLINLGPFPLLLMAHCIDILKEGSNWVAFVSNTFGNKLVRLDFGSSLTNTPTCVNLGTVGGLNMPAAFSIINENGIWYLMVVNAGNQTLSRLTFGNSLFNFPTGVNLGNVVSPINMVGITLIRDCNVTNGFLTNYVPVGSSPNMLYRLNFPNGIGGSVTGTGLGNIGNLDRPGHFSEIFRQDDTLFLYITNLSYSSPSITRLSFMTCTNASVPSSTLYDPPPYSYNQPGTYNINLIVNEGMANQASLCKNIVVLPAPIVNLGADRTICPGSSTVLNAGPGFSSYLWSTGATTQSISISNPGNYWVRVTNYGCEDYDSISVFTYPPVPVDLGPDAFVCQGTSYTFDAGACGGCTYVWSNLTTGQPNIGTGQTFSTETSGTYMVTKTNSFGCVGRDTATLTVYPLPVMTTFPLIQTICSGNSTDIILTANQPGTTFSWTAALTAGNITGFSNGNGPIICQSLLNLTTIPGSVSYTITPNLGTCIGSPVIFTVTVNPGPILATNPLSQTICSGDTAQIILTASVPGASFTWTASGSSPEVSGYSNGNGQYIEQILTNIGFTTQQVTYSIIPTALGCNGPATDYSVFINPIPDVYVIPPVDSLCSGMTSNFNIFSHVSGSSFSWTVSGSSSNVYGFSDGSGSIISQVLFNTGINVEAVTYTITPFANGCPGLDYDLIASVIPIPQAGYSQPSSEICSQEFTAIGLLSNITGTSFSWTASSGSPEITGYSPGIGDSIRQMLFNTGNTIGEVIYEIIPVFMGCPGISVRDTIRVLPIPIISAFPSSEFLCSGQQTGIGLSSSLPGTQFLWTCIPSSINVSGFSAGSGTSIVNTLINTGFSIETVNYIISSLASGCNGNTLIVPETVYPLPDVIISPNSATICSGNDANAMLTSNVPLTTFSWNCTISSMNISGCSPGTGPLLNQTLTNVGYIPEWVDYTIDPIANGCPGSSSVFHVIVNPLPFVSFTACFDTLTTITAQPIRLTGGIPLGGLFNGPGVNTSMSSFTPSIAGLGIKTITYSFTNIWACSSSTITRIRVVADSFLTCGNNLTDIRDGQSYSTVLLGSQCWMAENLNFGANINSVASQRNNCIPEKYCYNNLGSNCFVYGGLYQWDEMMEYCDFPSSKGVCPPSWHIPTATDWIILFANYYNNAFAGSHLLYSGYSGFNALISGVEHENKQFNYAGFATMIWSSEPHGPGKAWAHGMNDYDHSVSYYPSLRSNAFSVRCIKD